MKHRLLDQNHDYYCSDSNYYSNEGSMEFVTLADFLDQFEDADIDMNLCFRWDILKYEETDEHYHGIIHLMLQRKGIFRPCSIERVDEESLDRFQEYLEKHYAKLQNLWSPISGN